MQAILFVDDKTVSKGMVKYATAIPRESIVDVSGEVHIPETPVAGCTCSKVSPADPLIMLKHHLGLITALSELRKQLQREELHQAQ